MNPLVTVIVPTHLDKNAGYLELCLESILASQDIDFEVICIADTVSPPKRITDPRLKMYWDRSLVTASDKFNWAVGHSTQSSKYLWLISDDVMITPQAMKTMILGMGDNLILCNPMSNCDNGSQFYTDLGIPVKLTKENLPVQMPVSNGMPFLIPVRQFISFYCTMIPRKVWQMVGELDGRMDYRWNDVDYCARAAKQGVQAMINLGAFALHFGDQSIPFSVTKEQMDACDKAFMDKYGSPIAQ